MKTYLIISVIVAGLATSAMASPESELKALEQQWSGAYMKGDTSFLKSVEAEDWTLVDPDGMVMTKAQDIKELEDKTFVVKSSSMSDVKVQMLGENYACATGLGTMNGTYKGEDFSGDYRFMDIFEKKSDKWRVMRSQVTRVKTETE